MANTQRYLIHSLALSCFAFPFIVGCKDAPPQTVEVEAQSPEDPVRHIQLDGEPNFRDVGGYATTDGRKVKWREIFRTGELCKLSDADVEKLDDLHLKTVVNFLLPEEIEKHGDDRLPEGVQSILDPITGERSAELSLTAQKAITTGNFDDLPAELNLEIHAILMEEAKEQYARLLRTLADPANRPLAFHCSHGVHRTGTATAILLSALGVPWETIREDYVLTNEVRREATQKALAKIRNKVAADREIAPVEVDMSRVEAFYILEGAYIDGALKAAEKQYGSMEGYIREGLGLSEEEITALRSELLE